MMINAMSYCFDLSGFSESIHYSVFTAVKGAITTGIWTRARWSTEGSFPSPCSSDPAHYEGVELQFLAGARHETAPRERDMLVAFPSYRAHRFAPVTTDTPKSLVVWVISP